MSRFLSFALFLALLPATGWSQPASYYDQVQQMYVGYYGRPGDSGGLDYWVGELEQNNGDMGAIIQHFGSSEEFLQRYGDLSYEELVNSIYQQLFNRDADSAGLQFYTDSLISQERTLGSIALDVANGADAENEDGLHRDNKIAAANAFTATVDSNALHYSTDEIAFGLQYLVQITDTNTDVDSNILQQTLSLFLSYSDYHLQMNTNFGTIELELFPNEAPLTVQNFLNYVDQEFFQQVIFHRVIYAFMIQGGGYGVDYVAKAKNAPIELEVDNNLQNLRGTIAMARTDDPHSATSEFFINHVDNAFLNSTGSNNGYAVFGQITAGMDVVDTIAALPTYSNDVPLSLVVIESVQRQTPTIAVRSLDMSADNVVNYFVNQYQIGLGPSNQFYWMPEQKSIVEIDLDNAHSNFAPIATVHLFNEKDSDDSISAWLYQHGGDVWDPGSASPQLSYALPASAVHVLEATQTGQQTANLYDYDNYIVSFSIDSQSIAGRFSFEAFSDTIEVAVQLPNDE